MVSVRLMMLVKVILNSNVLLMFVVRLLLSSGSMNDRVCSVKVIYSVWIMFMCVVS